MKGLGLIFLFLNCFWIYSQNADSLLKSYCDINAFKGCIAAVSVDGEIKYFGEAGFADDRTQTKFEKDTKTRIASIVKPMTAIGVMKLVEQKKISLNDPIKKYIPEYSDSLKDKITILQILSHTAGIPGYQNKKEKENKKNYNNTEEAFSIFKNRPLIAEPGTKFSYTSYGYVVLGVLIERVSGMPYVEYMQKEIWNPLKMFHTEQEDANSIYYNKANLFEKSQKNKLSSVNPTNLSDRVPGGGIHSTLNDLLKFGQAILDNKLISDSLLNKMLINQKPVQEGNGYGLGFTLYGENPDHGIVFGHGGAQTGASNLLFIVPKRKAVIIVLSNTSRANKTIGEIAVCLLQGL